jgi:Zn-dependent peptidase ImmA (M78 family)
MNDTVRISHYDFKIERIKGKTMVASEVYGLCVKDKQIIYIDTSATPAVQKDTLLHEILHAIWWTGYLEDDDKEERVVSVTATGLMQVLRDNPWLVEELK